MSQAPQVALTRAISGPMLLLFVIGDVLGAGIYALVGDVGARVGGAIWTAFLTALILALFTACAYAELVTRYPQAAGAALYINRAFRRPWIVMWLTRGRTPPAADTEQLQAVELRAMDAEHGSPPGGEVF
jgi:amino acid transporter